MSDRILVMHEGRIVGEIEDVARATQEQILGFTVTAQTASEERPEQRLLEKRLLEKRVSAGL